MKESGFWYSNARRRPGRFALLSTFALTVSVANASDIGGEVLPPPCSYDSAGAVVVGPPQCAGLSAISVVSGSGSVLKSFSAPANGGTVALPFRMEDLISGSESDLFFNGTLGPLLPLPADPQLEGNALGGRQFFSRMFSEILTNKSASAWTGFYIELRTVLDLPSTNSDGLSFGQISRGPQQLIVDPNSPGFSSVGFESNEADWITFSGGSIAPGESVILNFAISETLASPGFYLLQAPMQETPEPASFLLTVTALALLVCRWRVATAGEGSGNAARIEARRISARH
jgi:hypothetical protein